MIDDYDKGFFHPKRAAEPSPVAPDSLVARLRNPSLSCSKGQRGDIHHEAANRIEQLESMLRVAVEENTELQGLVAIRHTTEG
jgi:hypothetical protein